LVITDILMPQKEGIELIVALRKQQPTLRIIAISGGGLGRAGDYLAIAQHLNIEGTLQKPISQRELLEAVATALAPKV
jgi:YesN/AraC family two-component response regulator